MSNLTGSANFIKYLLFFFNFLFVISGIILLSIGIAVQAVYLGYDHFLDPKFYSVPHLLIAIGIIIFVIAFFGCCGAVKENYCMVLTFSCLLIFVFILELAAGISGYVLRNQTKDLIYSSFNETMPLYGKVNHTDVTKLWDEIQTDFDCCGMSSQEDWVKAINGVPLTCCRPVSGAVNSTVCDAQSTTLRTTGCITGFGNFIKAHTVSLGIAGITLAVIQFFGIFAACYIARQIKLKNGHTGL